MLSSESSCGDTERSLALSYVIVGDNLDKTINPLFMTCDTQHQSIHFFHQYAVLDRVDCSQVPDDHPVGDLSSLPLFSFLPSPEDSKCLRDNYATLLGRMVVEKIPCFAAFKDCVAPHLPHAHSVEMKRKSDLVSANVTVKSAMLHMLSS